MLLTSEQAVALRSNTGGTGGGAPAMNKKGTWTWPGASVQEWYKVGCKSQLFTAVTNNFVVEMWMLRLLQILEVAIKFSDHV